VARRDAFLPADGGDTTRAETGTSGGDELAGAAAEDALWFCEIDVEELPDVVAGSLQFWGEVVFEAGQERCADDVGFVEL